MVLDILTQASRYTHLLPGLSDAFAFVQRPDAGRLPDGRHPIDGDRVFALVQTYDTKPVADGFPEAHRRYADVQVVIAGTEWFGYAPLSDQPVERPYDADRDILFVRGDTTLFRLTPGVFALVFPHDAHLPGRTLTTPEQVRKIVIKIQMPPGA
jgi:YhcH/YjgK/YiaL family protein